MTRFPPSPRLLATLLVCVAAACESPAAPAACGRLPQVTVNVGETSDVNACFKDADGDVLNYTVASSNPAVATTSNSGTAISVRGVAPGNATITVTATDPEGLKGQQIFAVIVPNRAPLPRGTVPGVTVEVGATASVDASLYFSEPDGEALTYAAGVSDTAVARVSTAGSTITVTARARGGATITITASDPGGLSATQTFGVTVPNRAPRAVGAIEAQTIKVAQPVLFDVTSAFTDPDGDTLTYAVAPLGGDSVVSAVAVSGGMLGLLGLTVGATTLTVTARDPEGLAATQSLVVTVAPALTRLTFHSESEASPDWSPDRILFDSDRDGNPEIYVMSNVMSESERALTRLTNDTATDVAPELSPDETSIAFESDRDGNPEIYVMDADGSGVTRLTNHKSGDREPAWSPDGTRIAFHSNRDGNDEIYVMDADGSGLERLTNHKSGDRDPAWSPDGTRIAFHSDRDGNDEIYVMDADGSDLERLTNNGAPDRHPVWSPDGTRIAFHSDRDGNDEIYMMDADGTGVTRLTNNGALDRRPAWSPDGIRIAFISNRDGNHEIYAMRIRIK